DVLLDDLDEVGVGLVLEQKHALHCQIRRVDLEYESRIDHGFVFVMHLARDRIEMGLIGRIERIEHRRGDNARRGLSEKALGKRRLDRRREALEASKLGFNGLLVGIFEFSHAFGTTEYLAGFPQPRLKLLGEKR